MSELEKYTKNVSESVRVDRWLMAARFYKTRTQAGQACEGGKVKINGVTAKPGKTVKTGDELIIQHSGRYRKIKVLNLAERGLPPAVARLLYEEDATTRMTDEDRELLELQQQMEKKIKRKYKGRPTKKERRDILKHFK